MPPSPLRILLADLRHNFGGVLSTDCMPLGVGYMKSVLDKEFPASKAASEVHAYPDQLMAAMEASPTDVLMASNYVWNEELSRAFLRRAKRMAPGALTVMGGPNIPVEQDRAVEWMREHPEIDIYVLGEGDFVVRDIIDAVLESGSPADARDREIASCIVRRRNGELVAYPFTGRKGNLDEIPSPYLTGVMDKFFDGRLAPIIETNRGCPFRCTFCVQGTDYYTKVHYLSMERLEAEISYIGRMIRDRSPAMGTLRIADPNYGMYERDVEISAMIGRAQAEFGWPTFIDATTGKNRAERIIQSMEKVNGALVLYQAVQSLDEGVLRNIHRSNIKLESYEQMQIHVRGRGLRSTSDLILGLPGESLSSHLAGLFTLIDTGTHQAHCFQAMMLKGSEMESRATREKFRFSTRFRVLPKNFGIYGDEKVFDIEEIIVATDTLPFEDYVRARQHHLAFSIFWNDSWFADLIDFVLKLGVKRSEWLQAMLFAMEQNQGSMRELLDRFTDETVHELFPTKESCAAFYSDPGNFQRLCNGEIGDNLMYKYRALASFFLWKETCALALDATRSLLAERGLWQTIPAIDSFWSDLHRFLEARHAAGSVESEILQPVEIELHYDVPAWIADGCPRDPGRYAIPEGRKFRMSLSDEGSRELAAAFRVWSTKLTGLSKLVTRIRVTSQIRQPVALPSSGSAV